MSASPFAVVVELDGLGAHPGDAPASPLDPLDVRRLARLAHTAERLGFTAITFDDSPLPEQVRLDAVQRAAYLAPLTAGIGLLPVTRPAYTEPFHVATQLASLDWASAGRAGWVPDAASPADEARALDRPVLDAATLAQESDDAIEVARRLWDSWQDDAVIKDVATGRYLDADRLHYVDFETERYSIKGPLITPRPPQGQVVVAAEAGTAGVDIALVTGSDIAAVTAAATAARADGATRVWAELEVAVDSRGIPATRRIAPGTWVASDRLRHVGDAAGLVALLTGLAIVVDGVRLHVADLDIDLDEVGRAVLPALRSSTVGFVSPRPGDTLRASLGLPHPENRYTAGAPAPDRTEAAA